ncbi:hypothetical protein GUITHDRAFT_151079 [Guillardia theta CCMP2712]|uniref:Right handed beta helix domain-containing protein n=1 Tax=Guillardia theta (strain CCMP2712) TaxID=905079 RepID=L1JRC6_GUITC|nr:hypothetical protein GUITHDRAFT_151079 [Guillardia theta CCMP2712]EKX50819.1 hypothetical protein GUITHDRAFT_151079 [Guillardia theta CCMP2712]|eukprot:XP_005837799.1 hypothetical protein GUITHDRAFT_151079 [Guillardia theta CCMP2712]
MACGLHGRLGEESCIQLLGCGDILVEILRFVPIIVPDHVETLKEAVEVALPNQVIVLRRGEYIVGSNPGQYVIAGKQESGNTILQLMRDVSLCGESGTVLKGMLVIPKQVSCSMSNITITDAGQSCVRVDSGKLYLDNCSLICGHASAVRVEGDGEVAAKRCRLGGEGEIGKAVPEFYELPRTWIDTAGSVQEYGLRKNSCYGVFLRDRGSAELWGCEVSYCSESGIFLRDEGRVSIYGGKIRCCRYVFTSGDGLGKELRCESCLFDGNSHCWYDEDRPSQVHLL